jgi:hypothetical protein
MINRSRSTTLNPTRVYVCLMSYPAILMQARHILASFWKRRSWQRIELPLSFTWSISSFHGTRRSREHSTWSCHRHRQYGRRGKKEACSCSSDVCVLCSLTVLNLPTYDSLIRHSTGRGGAANLTNLHVPDVERVVHHHGEFESSGRGGAGNIRSRSASRDPSGRTPSRDAKEKHGIAALWSKVSHPSSSGSGDAESREE